MHPSFFRPDTSFRLFVWFFLLNGEILHPSIEISNPDTTFFRFFLLTVKSCTRQLKSLLRALHVSRLSDFINLFHHCVPSLSFITHSSWMRYLTMHTFLGKKEWIPALLWWGPPSMPIKILAFCRPQSHSLNRILRKYYPRDNCNLHFGKKGNLEMELYI